jgi:hypothetical protein
MGLSGGRLLGQGINAALDKENDDDTKQVEKRHVECSKESARGTRLQIEKSGE